jgi:maltose alpha-D-glucosyltransferase/alpha-amylase
LEAAQQWTASLLNGNMEKLFTYWNHLYPGTPAVILENFLKTISPYQHLDLEDDNHHDWYKDAVVYSLYVDLFNDSFGGLTQKLDYLCELGVNCLWLLPVLDSPMRDAGFDIKDYYKIRDELLSGDEGPESASFADFLKLAAGKGIRVIFDVALNHVSEEHPWFVEARKGQTNPYRNYFIWSDKPDRYRDARIIFKGIESSNWESAGAQYFFHRFFNFQPDLNYRNPEVLLAMCRVLLYWQRLGVDGFRADAIPYIWKEEGTDCENLPLTHIVVKFIRAILDYCKPGTLLLAEACQPPAKVVAYMGNGEECHAAYHFPLMPRIFKAIAEKSGKCIEQTLSPEITPAIPGSGQWFTFLRCHDELSLELVYVTEEERKFIHESYCHQRDWDFRLGEGISARLAELMQSDSRKILLAYSIMLGLPGTPVIYYGDEFAKQNDQEYYREMIKVVGKDDTRFLVRGRIDWDQLGRDLANPESLSSRVYEGLRKMIGQRRRFNAFGRGALRFIQGTDPSLFAFERTFSGEKLLLIHNMGDTSLDISSLTADGREDVLGSHDLNTLEPFGFRWLI